MCRVRTSLSSQLPGTALQPWQEVRGAQVTQVIFSSINRRSENCSCVWLPSLIPWAPTDGLRLPPAALATSHHTDNMCYSSKVFKVKCCIFPAIKFTKCWCFLSAASTKENPKHKPSCVYGCSQLLTEAGSGRRFSKDCWVAECLVLTKASVSSFLPWL